MRHTKKKTTSGFTIVESLVALGIVSLVSLGGLSTLNYIRKAKSRTKEICAAHVASTVEKFRSVGYFAAKNNFYPDPITGRTFSPQTSSSLASRGIPDDFMYPAIDILDTNSAPVLNNDILITSSLNALLAIYNSGSYCTAGAPYTGGGGAPSAFGTSAFAGHNLTLQIQPYNTTTGASLTPTACPAGLRIAPAGIYADSDSGSAFQPPSLRKATRSPNTRTNVGLKLRVTQAYTDEDGMAQSCSIEQRFQYPADIDAPPQPDLATLSSSSSTGSNCPGTTSTNSYSITIGYSSTAMEAGSVLICRDLSVIPTTVTSSATYIMAKCDGSGAPASHVPALRDGSGMVGQQAMNFSTPYSSNLGTRAWVPCDRVTVCGRSPAVTVIGAGTEHMRYQLTYTNLPYLCRAYIQYAAIDTASNVSNFVVTTAANPPADPTVPDTSSTTIAWDVPMPRCGRECGARYGQPPVYYYCSSSNTCPPSRP